MIILSVFLIFVAPKKNIMKKYLLLLFVAICINISSKAAPGDTTWVQANNTEFTHYGSFDSVTVFPAAGTTYRKILMIFTLGKYVCPGSPTYCGDWDYTVLNYLMTRTGDTLELGRLITPYANAAAPRTPWAWKQNYVYDVTDYANLLHDTATMRISYSGYSWGFNGSIRFAFIEGTPDRTVLGVQRLWHGSWAYGDTAHLDSFDINTHFTTVNKTAPVGTVTTDLKMIVTGHGSDPNGCCEFMSHNYKVVLNSSPIASQTVWRSDCGSNELYPQSGTWLYQRANWCPGDMVYPKYNTLPGITGGASFNIALQFDPYASTGAGSYTTEASLFYYGGMNKTLDASLDMIIAPTTDQNNFRENPICGSPTILVKNTGATTIDSITFQYGIQDSLLQTYTWVGTLTSLQDTEISLPSLTALNNVTGTSATYTFIAKITKVNNATDADSTNNMMTSSFVAAPVWPSPFKFLFKTNNEAIAPGSTICETSWVIYDMNNNIVRQHSNAQISTLYQDTVYLPRGCYKLQVYDSSCDGLNWWANSGTGITSGYIGAYKFPGTALLLNQNSMTGTYSNDFGCGFVQYFYSDSLGAPLAVSNVNEGGVAIEAYPNPSQGIVNVDISGIPNVHGKIQVIDMLGRVVIEAKCSDAHQQINAEQLANGVYTILFINDTNNNRLQTRLVIAK